jgi:hypothetical protein
LDPTLAALDRKAARRALLDMCAAADLDPDGAELIRLGSHAMFRLRSAPLIVRISPNSTRVIAARREVAVAEWLAAKECRPLNRARYLAAAGAEWAGRHDLAASIRP